jgi:hypothetical protein
MKIKEHLLNSTEVVKWSIFSAIVGNITIDGSNAVF